MAKKPTKKPTSAKQPLLPFDEYLSRVEEFAGNILDFTEKIRDLQEDLGSYKRKLHTDVNLLRELYCEEK